MRVTDVCFYLLIFTQCYMIGKVRYVCVCLKSCLLKYVSVNDRLPQLQITGITHSLHTVQSNTLQY